MVKMVPNMMVHKSNMSVSEGGGGKDKKVSVIEVLSNKPMPIIDKYGMDTFLIVGRMCSNVTSHLGS